MPSTEISSKSTIAKNTTLLYARTAIVMLVSLYTSRVIIQALGVEDYGVYTAIGGIVSILSVITSPIDNAISRFLTFELGRDDKQRLKRYFSTGLTIMLLFSILAVLLLEFFGLWFINNKMVVDESRMEAANWVLHFSIAAFVINLISSPFRASIIAHERMSLFAYMGILDVVLKLAVAFLIKFSSFDKLVLYAILLFVISVIVLVIYYWACNRDFEECRKPSLKLDKELFRGLFSFAGWNMFGGAASFCRGQGINILFNLFGGPIVNAAYGVAHQVNAAIENFVNSFTTALTPPIIKSYASSQKNYMLDLVYQGAKYSYFLIYLFALPIMLETEYITKLWLGQIPDYAVVFIQLMLVHSIIESLSKTIMAGVNASGRIRLYQIVIGGFQILILPISYYLLSLGLPPTSALVATIVIDCIALLVRVIMAQGIFSLSFTDFFKRVIIVTVVVTLLSVPLPLFLRLSLEESFFRFLLVSGLGLISSLVAILFIGCTSTERASIISKARSVLKLKRND